MNSSSLKLFLNYGYLGKLGALLAPFFPKTVCKYTSSSIFNNHKPSLQKSNHKITISSDISELNDTNAKVISEIIKTSNLESVICAIVHGSIATNERLNYSDFDGILIIDESKIRNVRDLINLRRLIYNTELEMLKIDSLQHHGWQIILKSDLNNYNNASLPAIIFEQSKILYPNQVIELNIYINELDQNYQLNFLNIKDSILNKLSKRSYTKSFYSFKNLISEILLIPTLHFQAKYKKGIYKKDSFEWLENEYSIDQKLFFKEITDLRSNWLQEEVILKNELLAHKFKSIKLISNFFRTRIPKRYANWLNDSRKDNLKSILTEISIDILQK